MLWINAGPPQGVACSCAGSFPRSRNDGRLLRSFFAAVGFKRRLVYLAGISDILANLAAVPWGWLALDATLIDSPVVGVIVLRCRGAIARLGRRTAMALAIGVLLPFLIDLLSLA